MSMRWIHGFVLLALAQGTCAGACGGGPPIPEPDECSNPGAGGGITELAVGTMDEAAFTPIEDGATVETVTGGQGASMLPVRFRIFGNALPECIMQKATLTSGDYQLVDLSYQLSTYEESDGSRTTKALFMILDGSVFSGQRVDLHVEIFGRAIDRTLKIAGGRGQPLEPMIEPSTIGIAPGGTGILSFSTDWLPFDPLDGSSNIAGVLVPSKIGGAQHGTFRVRAREDAIVGATATVRFERTPESAQATVQVESPFAPGPNDLIVREALIPTSPAFANGSLDDGDANCDGAIDPLADQFIELLNFSARPLQLEGVALSVSFRDNAQDVVAFTFPALVLGPGEVVTVFSGALGDPSKNPSARCAGFGAGGRVGDGAAIGGAGFDLRDALRFSLLDSAMSYVGGVFLGTAQERRTSIEIEDSDLRFMSQPELRERPMSLPFTPGLDSVGHPFALVSE